MKIDDKRVESLYPVDYKLSEYDKLNLFCIDLYVNDFVKKDNIIYHIRRRKVKTLVNELLGELVAEYFGLDTVKSILYKDEYFIGIKYCLLTKLFTNSKGNYAYIDKLFPDFKYNKGIYNLNNLNRITIDNKFYKIDEISLKRVILSLKKMIILDYLLDNSDRNDLNFMFSYDKNNISLAPLYDYESSFGSCLWGNIFYFNVKDKKIIDFIRKDEDFQVLLDRAMELDMDSIFDKLTNEYPIKLNKTEIKEYSNVINRKQKEIKEYRLIR